MSRAANSAVSRLFSVMASRTPATLWLDRLSARTMSPGARWDIRTAAHRREMHAIHGSIQHHRYGDCVISEPGDESRCFPVSVRYGGHTTFALWGASSRARHVVVTLVHREKLAGSPQARIDFFFHCTRAGCTSWRSCSLACRVFLKLRFH